MPRYYLLGFTLLELLVVLAIIAMATTLVIPHLNSGQVTLLKAQVREAVAVLNYARRSAIVQGKPSVATFYDAKQATQSITRAEPGRWVSRGATLQWGGEVTTQDKAVFQITFYPEGGSSGGEIILTYNERKAKIQVNALTGKIQSSLLDENDKSLTEQE